MLRFHFVATFYPFKRAQKTKNFTLYQHLAMFCSELCLQCHRLCRNTAVQVQIFGASCIMSSWAEISRQQWPTSLRALVALSAARCPSSAFKTNVLLSVADEKR